MSLLEVSNLQKSYNGHRAVDGLSFRVDAGEIFGLLGPNGAGKSTAMMIIAGLRQQDGGSVAFDGRPRQAESTDWKMLLGVVPQDLAIYPDLTARENLDFFGRLYGMNGSVLSERIRQVLDYIGLADRADDYGKTFSGGMKRRLNFGAALLHRPRLVILDEPTVGVDPQSRSHLLDRVRQLSADGVGVIYCSHYMEEVTAICHRVAIIDHGKMLASGTLDELLDSARSDIQIRVRAPAAAFEEKLRENATVAPLTDGECQIVIRRERNAPTADINQRLAGVLAAVSQAGAELLSMETREHNLEQLFLELTGRRLRD
jgi:ABC-2 type transport system ATP-binding protein